MEPSNSIVDAQSSVDAAKRLLDEKRGETATRERHDLIARFRENPLTRGVMRHMIALAAGIPLVANAAEPSEAPPSTLDAVADVSETIAERPEQVTASIATTATDTPFIQQFSHQKPWSAIEEMAVFEAPTPDSDDYYRSEIEKVAKTIEGGEASPEYYARVGRPEWTPYQRVLFMAAPVQERFTELHSEYRNLSTDQFIEAYPDMLLLAKTEFRFSNLYRFHTDAVIDLFVAEAATMKPTHAKYVYERLSLVIGNEVGLAEVVRLTDALLEKLPADHPIVSSVEKSGYAKARLLVGRSRSNVVHMDQLRGELHVYRTVGDEKILIDSFPAIGGKMDTPTMSVRGKPAGSEFVHVPDITLTVAVVRDPVTSWSYQGAWVPGNAEIRDRGDELQYRHPSTRQWYDLTGPNAAFFPDAEGNVSRPFDGHMTPTDYGLIRAATHRDPSGATAGYVPKPWTRDEILSRNGGEVPAEWKWNDFGPMALRLATPDGYVTGINIHSKPNQDDFFSDRTHGCFASYAAYVREMVDRYGVGVGTKVEVTTK